MREKGFHLDDHLKGQKALYSLITRYTLKDKPIFTHFRSTIHKKHKEHLRIEDPLWERVCREVVDLMFFQAEDGMRYTSVTGVQTCALPICSRAVSSEIVLSGEKSASSVGQAIVGSRSEERRVGKEGRSRWSPYH